MTTQTYLQEDLPIFLDIEASGLSLKSYPIEIAWSNPKGLIESHLIDISQVKSWVEWDDYAEQHIHGISRQECSQQGKHPEWLCDRLSKDIGRMPVYASDARYDQDWVDKLYEAGSVARIAPFYIQSSDALMLSFLAHLSDAKAQDRLNELKDIARNKVKDRHRAAPDVQFLVELYLLCKSERP